MTTGSTASSRMTARGQKKSNARCKLLGHTRVRIPPVIRAPAVARSYRVIKNRYATSREPRRATRRRGFVSRALSAFPRFSPSLNLCGESNVPRRVRAPDPLARSNAARSLRSGCTAAGAAAACATLDFPLSSHFGVSRISHCPRSPALATGVRMRGASHRRERDGETKTSQEDQHERTLIPCNRRTRRIYRRSPLASRRIRIFTRLRVLNSAREALRNVDDESLMRARCTFPGQSSLRHPRSIQSFVGAKDATASSGIRGTVLSEIMKRKKRIRYTNLRDRSRRLSVELGRDGSTPDRVMCGRTYISYYVTIYIQEHNADKRSFVLCI